MTAFICVTCGTQFSETREPPDRCPVCDDARQFVNPAGQAWTSAGDLARRHRNSFRQYEPGVIGIGTVPDFAIGQRALLIRHPQGNVLWDCIALLDDATIEIVRALGGLRAIAISHPHYYTTMVDWSRAFGNVPVYLHEDDRQWVMRPDPNVSYWGGDRLALADDLVLLRLGGHFEGGTVLHAASVSGSGALFSGDIIQVVQDRRWVSFMRSYPNLIPLGTATIRQIIARLGDVRFERIYGAWWDTVVSSGGRECVERSAARYIAALDSQ
jgi:glyoxylase-like metal-dependent hydrolase (beta-lactamase superfamily II)